MDENPLPKKFYLRMLQLSNQSVDVDITYNWVAQIKCWLNSFDERSFVDSSYLLDNLDGITELYDLHLKKLDETRIRNSGHAILYRLLDRLLKVGITNACYQTNCTYKAIELEFSTFWY